ncbi:MAG: hypothetical protein WC867_03675 [Candidatus Pacearchaeota archaeon]|jgi:hypothetical protein
MDEQKRVSKTLSDLFPTEEFGRVYSWTIPETSERIPERLLEFVKEHLIGSPNKGCLYFQKKPEGGYTIQYYVSNKPSDNEKK